MKNLLLLFAFSHLFNTIRKSKYSVFQLNMDESDIQLNQTVPTKIVKLRYKRFRPSGNYHDIDDKNKTIIEIENIKLNFYKKKLLGELNDNNISDIIKIKKIEEYNS